ncbi:conserved hypothetical protein [Oenococcus oeni]|nr:conserved hypothetical protein [Oenococcus oeni]SYW09412.1 conserved hypothetical protein [Oenococcus oeni]SYW14203.1 conserved hypothetical protein [Oenococcus oeni]SYW15767.1 conserved hypothetical protein [Oenococcus oeni]SYW19412.1 conserved hypothetical protein [Oenococcus oeni]
MVSNGILPERRFRITNGITNLLGITMLITVWRFGNESSQKAIKRVFTKNINAFQDKNGIGLQRNRFLQIQTVCHQ